MNRQHYNPYSAGPRQLRALEDHKGETFQSASTGPQHALPARPPSPLLGQDERHHLHIDCR